MIAPDKHAAPRAMPQSRVRTYALWTIVLSIVVMAIKFAAYFVSGSVALYSDALESIVNVVAAVGAFMAIRFADKPADEDHPFGHYKAEYVSAVAEGVLIVVAALVIINEAVGALIDPRPVTAIGIGIVINLFATALNGLWAWRLHAVGSQTASPALEADSIHLATDVWTSVGVVSALLLVKLTGWTVLDPVVAIVVALNILWQGWKVVSGSVNGLMDSAVPAEQADRIALTLADNAGGAIEIHDIKTRRAGRATFVEFHLVVDGTMSVRRSHAICDRIEDALEAEVRNCHVTIHVEPDEKSKDEALVL